MSLVKKILLTGAVGLAGISLLACSGRSERMGSSPFVLIPPTLAPATYLSPSPTQIPAPIPTPAISAEFLALESQLTQKVRDYETGYGMNISSAVTDLQSGQTISVDGNELHQPGCVINQFPVYAVVQDAQDGKLDLGDMDWYIKNSVNRSNPASTAAFLSHYYGSIDDGEIRVQQWMDEHGIEGTYDHIPTLYDGVDNMLTALSTNKALTMLAQGRLFNPELTGYVINNVMTYSNFLYAIPSGVDADERVAHKIGYFADYDGWSHNDSGIVFFPGKDSGEKAFVISIFTSGGAGEFWPFSEIAQDLTRTANNYFREAY